jgi:phage tail sheath gpL-like
MARTTGTHTKATGTATFTANVSNNDTIIIGNVTYRFQTTPAQANDIDVGASLAVSLDNLVAAINGTGEAGATTYYAGTATVPAVVASHNNTVLTLTARLGGTHANGIELREGTDGGSVYSISRTMQGGAGALHTFFADLLSSLNGLKSETYSEVYHVQNASNGA